MSRARSGRQLAGWAVEGRVVAARARASWAGAGWLALATLGACATRAEQAGASSGRAEPAATISGVTVEPAPEHLRGRVALPAGARIYSRPTFASASWTLTLPEPPLGASDIPRAKAFRVVGVVRSSDGLLGSVGDFVAVTNDLVGEGDDPGGCGLGFDDLGHLRMLVYVPVVHLAEVTTRPLVLDGHGLGPGRGREQLWLGAGARVGPAHAVQGLPRAPEGSDWRHVDADGIRSLAPIPADAIGYAWDPSLVAEYDDAGEALFRDAEGSTIWLRDDAGSEVDLTVRNPCAQQREHIDEPDRIERLRALALDAFYDQRPQLEPQPVVEERADYRIPAETPLRWPDGDLAGETLADWSVAIGVGQTWDGRRCFSLTLGAELVRVDTPALVCVDPKALMLLSADGSFAISDELDLGGSIELGPAVGVEGGPWETQALRAMLNGHHDSVSECLRPLLRDSEGMGVPPARWDLRLTVIDPGRVDEVEVVALGRSLGAVEDCLRAEAYSWLLPSGTAGILEVPITVGEFTIEPDADGLDEPEAEPEPKSKSKAPADPPQPERGKVVIIRDDDEPEPEAQPELADPELEDDPATDPAADPEREDDPATDPATDPVTEDDPATDPSSPW